MPSTSFSRSSDFYPRPPRGGRLERRAQGGTVGTISIHALREEGDNTKNASTIQANVFLSTPSARRATLMFTASTYPCRISIHALREEGDMKFTFVYDPAMVISIHALREEGDSSRWSFWVPCWIFLSTPSARRATAKTETKSLFSYKLYNILHEFRRALIYNGSKNYPNHAK